MTNPFLVLLHGMSFTELPGGHMWPQMQRDVTHKSRIPGEKSSSTGETCVVLDFLPVQTVCLWFAHDQVPPMVQWDVYSCIGVEMKGNDKPNNVVLSRAKITEI